MEWAGWFSLILLICAINIPGDVKKLKRRVRMMEIKLNQKQGKKEGGSRMSKIIEQLVGEECVIESDFAVALTGSTKINCKVLEADEEWIKISYQDKKKGLCIKIMRIDAIESIEIKSE